MQDQIVQALRSGATDEAVRLARAWLAGSPDDAQAYRWLAATLRQQGEHEAALDNIARAIALDPENADLHLEHAGLLLGVRQLGQAEAALARSTGLDPNQFAAYLAQAQLALGRGELDEAERLGRLAARVSPDDPQLAAVEGTVALRRGDADRALAILDRANRRQPDDPRLLHALGFAYMARQHWAFAEQAFRRVVELMPSVAGLQTLIAQLALRQNRPDDAFEAIDSLLAQPATDTPGMRRMAGELRLAAGFPAQALPYLKQSLSAAPGDRRTLKPLMVAWRQLGAVDEARGTLEAALATSPGEHELWVARLVVEEDMAGEAADAGAIAAVVGRWNEAMPGHVPALDALMRLQDRTDLADAAEATALRILALEPYHPAAARRRVEALFARDPNQAVACIEQMLAAAPDTERPALQHWLGTVLDRAGRVQEALQAWTTFNEQQAPSRLPLPPRSEGRLSMPAMPALADLAASGDGPVLVWGAPGGGVERLIAVLDRASPFLRGDRFGLNPPNDPFQRYTTVADLLEGRLQPAAVVDEWRALLPRRGLRDGRVIDWLPWWDNSLLLALRPHLPEGRLLVALRDPRDMLLEWIGFGSSLPLAVESPQKVAEWLAAVLEQVAVLDEQDLYPHALVRLDGIETDPPAVAQALETAFGGAMRAPVPPSVGNPTLPAGRWRAYTEVLAGPFAALAPVARRLGYPEA